MPEASVPFELSFSIAGMPSRLVVRGLTMEKRAQLQAWYDPFTLPGDQMAAGQNEWSIVAQVEPGDLFIPFKSGRLQVRTAQHGERVEFVSHQEMGWFCLAQGRGELVLRPEGNPENFLRAVYAWRCLARKALLVHASGVVRNGGGYVFFGPSGSGKTTTARLSPEATILSDDLVILGLSTDNEHEHAGVQVYGVPFRGEMIEAARTNASAPLIGLYTLVKDSAHRLDDLERNEATARLSACVPFVMSQPENAQHVLRLCEEITRWVRVRALHFRRDAGFWKVIDG